MSYSAKIAKESKNNKIYYKIRIPSKIRNGLGIQNKKQKFNIEHDNYDSHFKLIKDNDGSFVVNKDGYLYLDCSFTIYSCSENLLYFESIEDNILMSYEEVGISKQKIIKTIVEMNSKGVSLKASDIQVTNQTLYKNGIKYFKSWKNAVEKSGINYSFKRQIPKGYVSPNLKWTKEKVINTLLNLHQSGQLLTSTNIQKKYQTLYQATKYYFDSWEDVMDGLGIDRYKELKKSSNSLRKCGQMFEVVLDELLVELGYKYKKYAHSHFKPDYIFNKFHWGDAKLSEDSIFHPYCNTVDNYEKHCKLLTIVYLRGDKEKDEMITRKTRLISVYKLFNHLPKEKQFYFLKKFEELEDNIYALENHLSYEQHIMQVN
jgi:hypothetical protein